MFTETRPKGFLALLGRLAALTAVLAILLPAQRAIACGGFFCELVPIDQAGEQIIFSQQGDEITAIVRILYQGEAENFSWVVPVPSLPTVSIGADQTFDQLDRATRPQFILETEGQACPIDFGATTDGSLAPVAEADSGGGGVNIEQMLSVGPFEITIVSSDNPDDLATWLTDNSYDLSDRGRELIAPYVTEGMKFVAVKLKSGESTGSIQPLIMKYQGTTPMIPIRLTAVAAQDDMGVLAWVLGEARAVPDNYPHVIPNYTKLNWYTGPNNAYASYQSLITDAMNEAGGQGFATDMAAPLGNDVLDFLDNADTLRARLADFDGISDDAEFLSNIISATPDSSFQAAVSAALPLPEGQDSSIYFQSMALQVSYTAEELSTARASLRTAYIEKIIEPVENSTAPFTAGRYLTRLYTTLSADEMTLDPTFVYNQEMAPQSVTRTAKMALSCEADVTQWTLTLGAGTGRDGEKVIDASGDVPAGAVLPVEVTTQKAIAVKEITSADALPTADVINTFDVATIGQAAAGSDNGDDDDGFLGGITAWWLVVLGLAGVCRRYA